MFSWRLLVVCIGALVLATIYLFYSNRIIAAALNRAIMVLAWPRSGRDRIYIEFDSLSFSFLTGSLTFKEFKYHSKNQAVKMVSCVIVWRYWLLEPRKVDVESEVNGCDAEFGSRTIETSRRPCRFHVQVQGLDWCMYNRTAAFDEILRKLTNLHDGNEENPGRQSPAPGLRAFPSRITINTAATPRLLNSLLDRLKRIFSSISSLVGLQVSGVIPSFSFTDILPLSFEITGGAITCGNPSTPGLLIGQFCRAHGLYTVKNSPSLLDLYQQILTIKGTRCKIFLKRNPHFEKSMWERGKEVYPAREIPNLPTDEISPDEFNSNGREPCDEPFFEKVPKVQGEPPDLSDGPFGEYASEERILESNILTIIYVVDVPGTVQFNEEGKQTSPLTPPLNESPEWSIEVAITGGIMRYGPWADRQRVDLQRAFFPPSFQNAEQSVPRKPGEERAFPSFRILIEVEDDFLIQVPFREASKNWQWDGKSIPLHSGRRRVPAILNLKCTKRSALRYIVPMLAETTGYHAALDVLLHAASLTSSTNDILFLTATDIQVSGRLHSPLVWNQLHDWKFDFFVNCPQIRLLRDYITLFTDLGKDWVSGPPSDFHRWMPTIYSVQVEFRDYALQMFLNDHNIIDYPQVIEENVILLLRGATLRADARVSSDRFRPDFTTVPYAVHCPDVQGVMTFPKWDTRSVFASDRSTDIFRIPLLQVKGTFCYFSEVHEEFVDVLTLAISFTGLRFKLFGWVVRRFMIARENYFGTFTNFTTLSEYIVKRRKGHVGDLLDEKYRPEAINSFQLILSVSFADSSLLIPAGLPGYECTVFGEANQDMGLSLVVHMPNVGINLVVEEDGMELTIFGASLVLEVRDKVNQRDFLTGSQTSSAQSVLIDGVNVSATRLFGPKPKALTYLCIWSFEVGAIVGELPPYRIKHLSLIMQNFISNLKDTLNTPTRELAVEPEPDITILDMKFQSLDLTFGDAKTAFQLLVSCESWMHFDNVPGQLYNKITKATFPMVNLRLLRFMDPVCDAWLEVARIHLVCNLKRFGWYNDPSHALMQKEFVHDQDSSSRRALRVFWKMMERQQANSWDKRHIKIEREETSGSWSPEGATGRDSSAGDYLPYLAVYLKNKRKIHDVIPSDSYFKNSHPSFFTPERGDNLAVTARRDNMDFPDDTVKGTLVVSVDSLEILLTSSAIRLMETLFSSYYEFWPGPELLLDELLASVIASSTPPGLSSSSAIKIDVASMTVILLAGKTVYDSEFSSVQAASKPVLKILAKRAEVLIHNNKNLPTGIIRNIYLPELTANVFSILEKSRNLVDHSLLYFSLKAAGLGLSNAFVYVSFTDAELALTQKALLCAFTLLLDCTEAIAELAHMLAGLDESLRSRKGFFLWNVLNRSRQKTILNPLSSAKGSYLADSQKLRFDVSYSMLTYLRLCLTTLGKDEREDLMSWPSPHSDVSISLLDVERLVRIRWAEWTSNPEEAQSVRLPLLEAFYHPKSSGFGSGVGFGTHVKWQSILIKEISHPKFPNTLIITSGHLAFALESKHMANQSDAKSPNGTSPLISHITADILVESFILHVYPNILQFFEEAFRAQRLLESHSHASSSTQADKSRKKRKPMIIECIIGAERIRLRASAQNLLLDAGSSGLRLCASGSHFPKPDEGLTRYSRLSCNTRFTAREFFIRARSAEKAFQEDDSDILASVVMSVCNTSAGFQTTKGRGIDCSFLLGSNSVLCTVPRSATRTYQFIDEWRANYLPAFHSMLEGLLKELKPPERSFTAATSKRPFLLQSLVGACQASTFEVALQITHGVWLHWNINSILADCQSSVSPASGKLYFNGSLRLTEQVFHVGSVDAMATRRTLTTTPRSGIKLTLPCLTISGFYSDYNLKASAQLEYFKLSLKPQYFDDFLMVQKNLGSNYYDLLDLIAATRRKRISTSPVLQQKTKRSIRNSVSFALKGFQIKVKGPTSSQILQCSNISGRLIRSGRIMWKLSMKNLSLSLSPAPLGQQPSDPEDLDTRSAYISIDLQAELLENSLSVTLSSLQAFMSPSSVGEFGDLFDYVQIEMRKRQEQRAAELTDIRSKTRSFLKTFELDEGMQSMQKSKSWLTGRDIKVRITGFGIAFPLEGSELLPSPSNARMVRAFLFSISQIIFISEKTEFGKATLKNLSFQFVESFKLGQSHSFDGSSYDSHNRLLYPDMSAVLRSDRSSTLRRVKIGCEISGFVLHLDPSIIDYTFALVNVYRRGKERLSRLATFYEMEDGRLDEENQKSESSQSVTVPTSNILMSLDFLSGTIIMRPSIPQDEGKDELGIFTPEEIIRLPSLSVWAEFKATSSVHKLNSGHRPEPTVLMLKAFIHSSRNVLRPSILRFFTQITQCVEHQLASSKGTDIPAPLPTIRQTKEADVTSDLMHSLQVSFNLQIDRSQLELTCLPDVNVLAGVQWDSGGFLITISEGARLVCLTGIVEGLRANLRHGYLREKCAEIDARNLTFTLAIDKVEAEDLETINCASIVIDSELSASFRFSRLQDILCFRAVWLDHIPVFTKQSDSSSKTHSSNLQESVSGRRQLVTVLLFRARRLGLFVDMGSSVTNVSVNLRSLRTRTHLSDLQSDIEISIAEVGASFEHNLVGYASTPNFEFRTVRQRHGQPIMDNQRAQTLMMTLTSGALDIDLSSEGRRILYYHAQPIHVTVQDDVSGIIGKAVSRRSHLNLFFAVNGSEIVAMATIKTIPQLLALLKKIQTILDEQRAGAVKESSAFRHALSLKPKNPLTAVANAMIQSAKSRLKEMSSNLGYIMVQHMSLRLTKLQLAIFYRQAIDQEMALFTGLDIQAKLDHFTDSSGFSFQNKLDLSLTSMSIARVSALNHAAAAKNDMNSPAHNSDRTASTWLVHILKDSSESIIFKLPAMVVTMSSRDISKIHDEKPKLEYDFWSSFPLPDATMPTKEVDTEISLNISLYKWLAEFRTRLIAELALLNERSTSSTGPQEHLPSPPTVIAEKGIPADSFSNSKSASRIRSVSNASTSERTTSGLFDYVARSRHISRLTIRQLGDATPDILHPFFSKQAGFNIEEELPVYIHEYATVPLEQIMKALLKVYSRQFKSTQYTKKKAVEQDSEVTDLD